MFVIPYYYILIFYTTKYFY